MKEKGSYQLSIYLRYKKDAGPLSKEGEIHCCNSYGNFSIQKRKEFERLDLTIKKTVEDHIHRSSKIYGLRQHPR
ncbi:MAG: hypothetical protein MZV64_52425 [Ignavibacteriales bacterium]|nr:hypothetical protein [Ignavibacteriales bacterium]